MRNNPDKSAFLAAVEILSRQDYSKRKLIEKLTRKGYSSEEIAAAAEKLTEYGYLNDAELSKARFRFLYEESSRSVKEIKYKLLNQGFSAEDVSSVIPEDSYEREKAAAVKTLKLRYRKNKDPQKMRAYLFRHGFSTDICYEAAREVLEE